MGNHANHKPSQYEGFFNSPVLENFLQIAPLLLKLIEGRVGITITSKDRWLAYVHEDAQINIKVGNLLPYESVSAKCIRENRLVMQRNGSEVLGINTKAQLAEVAALKRKSILNALMSGGVTIIDPYSTYVDANGIKADRKNMVLSYEKGQLKAFLNNWPLYNVVGAPKISAEEARAIAIEASKNFSYQVTIANGTVQTVTGFKIATESLGHEEMAYLNFNDQNVARGSDPFTLYPAWYVSLGFDKFYPGDVSSMMVVIWADTGEVADVQMLSR